MEEIIKLAGVSILWFLKEQETLVKTSVAVHMAQFSITSQTTK